MAEKPKEPALEAYNQHIGLELSDVTSDGCITKIPCYGEQAGRSSLDRGKQGIKHSTLVDADCMPLGAACVWPISRLAAVDRDFGHLRDIEANVLVAERTLGSQ